MPKKKKKSPLNKYLLYFPFVFIFLIYLHNLTHDIYGGDVGDLVTAAFSFGVAHPPGYPTFTLLGYLFSRLPVDLPIVGRIALVSLLSSIGSLVIYFNFSKKITKNISFAFMGMFTLAFSYLFWLYSEMPEAFSPNVFLAFLTIYLAYLFYKNKKDRYLYALAFLCTFNLSNHHSIILLYPGVLILISSHWKYILNPKRILISFGFLILGFAPYIYIPFAASKNPVMNWDSVTDVNSLLHLFLRKDYGTFSSGNFQKAKNIYESLIIVKTYFALTIKSITLPAFVISLLGLFAMFRQDKRLFFGLLVSYILSGPLFVLYSGFPLVNSFIIGISERFYILSSSILLIAFPSGLVLIKNAFSNILTKKIYIGVVVSIFWIIPISLFAINFNRVNLSKNSVGNRLGYDVLKTLPKNSIIFLDGDTVVTNTWYVHYVLGFRQDVVVAQLGGFANNYYIDDQFEVYRNKYGKYGSITDVLNKTVLPNRPVYYISQIPYKNVLWVPEGLSSKYMPKGILPDKNKYIKEQKDLWNKINPPKRADLKISERNLIPSFIPLTYSSAVTKTADFIYKKYHDVGSSLYFYKLASDIDPQYSLPYINMGIIQSEDLGLCREAEVNIQKGIDRAIERQYFLVMYLNYKNCFNDSKKADTYRKYLMTKYNWDIEKDNSSTKSPNKNK
ncbi:MAG TPA: DUF2723 domain-containing protein [Patescibacteria group bacterium]|nr:DUF2723 domain-containing protein [Patescibacteria group bacterium]